RQAVRKQIHVRLAARLYVVAGSAPGQEGAVTGCVVVAARTAREAAHGSRRDVDELVRCQRADVLVVGWSHGVLDTEVGVVGGGRGQARGGAVVRGAGGVDADAGRRGRAPLAEDASCARCEVTRRIVAERGRRTDADLLAARQLIVRPARRPPSPGATADEVDEAEEAHRIRA